MTTFLNKTTRIDRSGLVRLPFPAEIAIETHAFCNFKCVVCPYATLKRTKGRMLPELFKKIVDEVGRESPETRLWLAIMGEPLLDKNIIPFIRYAQENGVHRIHLNTNGTFLEGQLAKDLIDSGVEAVYVAIDAAQSTTFEKVRPGGDFHRIVKNVENFLSLKEKKTGNKPEICVQYIVMAENESEIDAFHDYWIKRGAVVKIRLRQGWGNQISTPDLDTITAQRIPCPWLLRTMNIHWNGCATQCDVDYEEHFPAGDINVQSIRDVWDGELSRRRELHWNEDFSHPLCRDCKDWASGRAEFSYPTPESKAAAPRWSLGEKKKRD